MVSGVPVRSGSMYFSSVERYLTLSFASLFASVIELSSSRQRLSTRDFEAPSTPSTTLHSRPRSCSVIALNLVMRVRQYSSSVSGPASSLSLRALSLSASSFSVSVHHWSHTASKAVTMCGSLLARVKAVALFSMSKRLSGRRSVKPPCSDETASASVSVNLLYDAKNSAVVSSTPTPGFQLAESCVTMGR